MTARVVILGGPTAGKTALLRSLARAATMQERQLGGRVRDPAKALANPRGTVTIEVDPWTGEKFDSIQSFPVELCEVDGAAAAEVLTGRSDPKGLAAEVRAADALIIVVDANAGLLEVAATLADYLAKLRDERGRDAQVGAWPVFVVASQCDRLARPGDTASIWAERVEAAKEELTAALPSGFDRDGGFGGLRLSVAAIAVEPPPLANAGPASGPVGVADLFRDVLFAARDSNSRRAGSSLHLRRTLIGLSAAALAVLVFGLGLAASRAGWFTSPLAVALAGYREREGRPPAGHLDEPVGARVDQLLKISIDPGFARLAAADRAFVADRLESLRQHESAASRLHELRKPAEARDSEELEEIDTHLRELQKQPDPWSVTDAGRVCQRRGAEVLAIKSAVKRSQNWFDEQRRAAESLYLRADSTIPWARWLSQAKAFVEDTPPFPATARLPGWPEESSSLTYAMPLAFAEVVASRTAWQAGVAKLQSFAEVAKAIGLCGGDCGDLRVTPSFPLTEAPALLATIRSQYPGFDRWTFDQIPDAARDDVRKATRDLERRLIAPARTALAGSYSRVPLGVESPRKWTTALESLRTQPGVAEWLDLVKKLRTIAGHPEPDPIAELTTFVGREAFALNVLTARLGLPDDLPKPTEFWTFAVQNVNGETITRQYKLTGTPTADPASKLTWYTFSAEGPTSLEFHSGDVVLSEARLRDAAGVDWLLSWWAGGYRSRLFQFDRLTRVPRLHKADQKAEEGMPAEGVRLEFDPEGGIPRVPDLMPEVKAGTP